MTPLQNHTRKLSLSLNKQPTKMQHPTPLSVNGILLQCHPYNSSPLSGSTDTEAHSSVPLLVAWMELVFTHQISTACMKLHNITQAFLKERNGSSQALHLPAKVKQNSSSYQAPHLSVELQESNSRALHLPVELEQYSSSSSH